MNTSLDHLPLAKRDKILALAEHIRSDAPAEMIILFGSFARGDWVDDPVNGYFSDFDLLVIVKTPALVDKHNLWSTIEQRSWRRAQPHSLSLLVHDIADVNRQLEAGYYFFSDIKKEGILIYDSGIIHLADAKTRSPAERAVTAQMWFDQWFKSACEFLRYHELGVGEGFLNSAAFQLHQATERFYHAALLVLTAYKPKTHNIEDLGKRAGDLHPDLRNVLPHSDPEDARLFKLLKRAYVDARYDPTYAITADELAVLAAHVRDLKTRVERVCRDRIAALAGAEPHQEA